MTGLASARFRSQFLAMLPTAALIARSHASGKTSDNVKSCPATSVDSQLKISFPQMLTSCLIVYAANGRLFRQGRTGYVYKGWTETCGRNRYNWKAHNDPQKGEQKH